MNQRLANQELFIVTSKLCTEINTALQNTLGKSLWNVSETNRLKLYNLWIWSERHKVSLDYILSVLVPYFSRGVERRTGRRSKGLGVSIPVLTGTVAEEILQKAITKDFADGDNIVLAREEAKDKIISMLEPIPEFRMKIKKSIQYKSIMEEAKAYETSITKSVKKDNKIAKKFRKIPYRNNPFR